MTKKYIDNLKDYFYLSGSVARYKYKKPIMVMLTEISETLPKIFEKENAEYAPHDLDLIFIDKDNIKMVEKIKKEKNLEIVQVKKDLIMLKDKKKELRIDIFICNKKNFYLYYLFTLLGKKINIILRKKSMKNGLLLNQYGLFDRETQIEIKIKYNNKKSIFYNIGLIIKKVYSFDDI